jgi:hypothetical protein
MTCPLCTGACALLGALGNLKWFRCTSCGMNCSKTARKRKGKK